MSDDTKGVVNQWDWIRIEYNEIEPLGGVPLNELNDVTFPKCLERTKERKFKQTPSLSRSLLLSVREM